MNAPLKAILFDLDGTLIDTAPDLAFALNEVLQQQGKPPIPYEKIRPLASTGSPGLLGLAFNIDPQHPEYASRREQFINAYHKHLCVGSHIFSGMDAVLKFLNKHKICWGVVTNKPSFLAEQLLNDLQLDSECRCIVGGDATVNRKPHPDPLLYACQLIQQPPSVCVYIGDAERDIIAAKQAGMTSIAALYGYLPENTKPASWEADFYINQPKELIPWLKKRNSLF